MLLHRKKCKCLQLVVRRRRRGRGVVEVVLVYTSSVTEQRTRTWVCYIHTRTHSTARARARERVRYDELHDLVVIMSITQLWLMSVAIEEILAQRSIGGTQSLLLVIHVAADQGAFFTQQQRHPNQTSELMNFNLPLLFPGKATNLETTSLEPR